jgi:cytosine/adenosine deaminase-related metal-dependent hydrolase
MRVLLLVLLAANALADTYVLRGTLVTPETVIPNGALVVTDGVIADVGAGITTPPGAREIDTGGFIYPGLIDLHNHLTWNVHPRWLAGTLMRNRYEWQALDSYAAKLAGPQSAVRRRAGCDMERFGEVKALVWGATSTTGGLLEECSRGLARNLDYYSGLFSTVSNMEPLQYRIFPLELKPADEDSVRKALAKNEPVIVHLAEGVDASAARELRMADAHQFLKPGFIVIHGVPLLDKDFADLGAKGVGFIWSPRSNDELYGRTADVAAAKKYVIMAIAPDWSPSGSSGMLDELRYAALWNGRQFPVVFKSQELVQMATSNAAKLARIDDKVGRLAKGLRADYVVVRAGALADPYESLIYASHENMLLVAVEGRPLYGDETMMKAVHPDGIFEALTVCGARKAVDMSDSDGGKGISWADTIKNLTAAFAVHQLPMAGLAECP